LELIKKGVDKYQEAWYNKVYSEREEKTMEEMARQMAEEMGAMVMDYSWVLNAISAYCYDHNISLTEDEEMELADLLMDM
jgi:hypothetical protein